MTKPCAGTHVCINVDFLEDVLKDPAIRGATEFCQVLLLGCVDCDQCMILLGNKQFMEITNYNSVSRQTVYTWERGTHVLDSQLHQNASLQRTIHSGYRTSRGHILALTIRFLFSTRSGGLFQPLSNLPRKKVRCGWPLYVCTLKSKGSVYSIPVHTKVPNLGPGDMSGTVRSELSFGDSYGTRLAIDAGYILSRIRLAIQPDKEVAICKSALVFGEEKLWRFEVGSRDIGLVWGLRIGTICIDVGGQRIQSIDKGKRE
jgi:hypothetical protein